MFEWLVDAGYLRGNPMALLKRRRPTAPARVTRYLPEARWSEVLGYVARLPRKSDIEHAYAVRCRWLTTLFCLTGMRISEVAAGSMGQFRRRIAGDGETQWWLNVTGKGDRERDIPASKDLIVELGIYRQHHGLSLQPGPDDRAPLLISLRGAGGCMTTVAVHKAIKRIFRETAASLELR
jgi:integrase